MTDAGRFPPGYFDKHLTRNPLARLLLRGHYRTIEHFVRRALASSDGEGSILEIGCNRGAIAEKILAAAPKARLVGLDLDGQALCLGKTLVSGARFVQGSAFALPFRKGAFDVIVLCEILEHLGAPDAALAEAERLAPRFIVASVPREPLWRALNMARGAYWSDFGNTPGHIRHFTRDGFLRFVESRFRVVEVRTPMPWTMVLAERR